MEDNKRRPHARIVNEAYNELKQGMRNPNFNVLSWCNKYSNTTRKEALDALNEKKG